MHLAHVAESWPLALLQVLQNKQWKVDVHVKI